MTSLLAVVSLAPVVFLAPLGRIVYGKVPWTQLLGQRSADLEAAVMLRGVLEVWFTLPNI